MKKITKITVAVFLAVLLSTTPVLTYADEPQSSPSEQQAVVAPADQSADQQTAPAAPVAPAPQEEGAITETGK